MEKKTPLKTPNKRPAAAVAAATPAAATSNTNTSMEIDEGATTVPTTISASNASVPTAVASSVTPAASASLQPSPSDGDLSAWDAEVRAAMTTADTTTAVNSTKSLPLKSGIHLPFAVLHEDERHLFDTILSPAPTSHGYTVNYDALDAWIAETEQIIDAEMMQAGLPPAKKTKRLQQQQTAMRT